MFECSYDVFCKIPARKLMSLVWVLITWAFHKSFHKSRWLSFTGREFSRMAFKNNRSAIALKNFLSIFDLKMHCYFASVIFDISFIVTF